MSFAALETAMLDACYAALASDSVVRGSASFKAVLTQADEAVFGGHAVAADYALRYRLIDAPGVVPGESLTVNGIQYRVQGDPVHRDGMEAVAQLVRMN